MRAERETGERGGGWDLGDLFLGVAIRWLLRSPRRARRMVRIALAETPSAGAYLERLEKKAKILMLLTGPAGAVVYLWIEPQAELGVTFLVGLPAMVFVGLPLVFLCSFLANAYDTWFR